jgi:hypothetical protein
MRKVGDEILGACLFDSANLALAIERGVEPSWFENNGAVFKALCEIGQEWDKRTSINVLEAAGIYTKHPVALDLSAIIPEWSYDLEEVGGALEVLAGEHAKRCLTTSIVTAQSRLATGDDPFNVGADLAIQAEELDNIGDAGRERTTKDVANAALEIDEKIAVGDRFGLPFPWHNFQRKTFGLPTKAVVPLMGRDGVSKSRLATYLAHFWVSSGIPILYFAFEDSAERFMSNLAATHGEYDMFSIKRDIVNPDFMPRHTNAMSRVSEFPIYVEDMPCSAEKVFSHIAKYKRKYDIEGVVIDGIKDVIFSKGEATTSQENHRDQVINRAAKRFDVSVLTISHINKIDEDKWISRRNITGSDNQNKSARMTLVYQDSGFPGDMRQKFMLDEGDMVLQCQKASYGDKGYVCLRPELEKGRFVEIPEGGITYT